MIGGATGAVAGAIIGSIIPGIGTAIRALVGGMIGSAAGGLFGGKAPKQRWTAESTGIARAITDAIAQIDRGLSYGLDEYIKSLNIGQSARSPKGNELANVAKSTYANVLDKLVSGLDGPGGIGARLAGTLGKIQPGDEKRVEGLFAPYVAFAANYRKTVDRFLLAGQAYKAESHENIRQAIDEISEFIEKANTLQLPPGRTYAAARNYAREALGMIDDVTKTMSSFSKEIYQLNVVMEEGGPLLAAVGLSYEEFYDYFIKKMEELQKSFTDLQLDRIADLTDDVGYKLGMLYDQYLIDFADAQKLFLDGSIVTKRYGFERWELLKNLNEEQIEALQDQLTAVEKIKLSLQGLLGTEGALTIQRRGTEALLNAVHALATRLTTLVKTIDTTIVDLQTGQLSPLAPQDQLQMLLDRFGQNLAAGRAGDVGALESLPNLAKTLLDAAREVFASGPGYQSIFAYVLDALREGQQISQDLAAQARTSEEILGQQLDLLDHIEKILTDSSLSTEEMTVKLGQQLLALQKLDATLLSQLDFDKLTTALVTAQGGTVEIVKEAIGRLQIATDASGTLIVEAIGASAVGIVGALYDVTGERLASVLTAANSAFQLAVRDQNDQLLLGVAASNYLLGQVFGQGAALVYYMVGALAGKVGLQVELEDVVGLDLGALDGVDDRVDDLRVVVEAGIAALFERGGYVQGPAGNDNVPAWLSRGEYVVRRSSVEFPRPQHARRPEPVGDRRLYPGGRGGGGVGRADRRRARPHRAAADHPHRCRRPRDRRRRSAARSRRACSGRRHRSGGAMAAGSVHPLSTSARRKSSTPWSISTATAFKCMLTGAAQALTAAFAGASGDCRRSDLTAEVVGPGYAGGLASPSAPPASVPSSPSTASTSTCRTPRSPPSTPCSTTTPTAPSDLVGFVNLNPVGGSVAAVNGQFALYWSPSGLFSCGVAGGLRRRRAWVQADFADLTLPLPAGVAAGDTLFVFGTWRSASPNVKVPGFTRLFNDRPGNSRCLALFWKTAGARSRSGLRYLRRRHRQPRRRHLLRRPRPAPDGADPQHRRGERQRPGIDIGPIARPAAPVSAPAWCW